MNLYIYSYNNYYNRTVKKAGDSIEDYEQWLHYGPVQGVYGFTPSDGVNTEQLIGANIQTYDGKGNYLIAHNPQTNEIDSRWFIIDSTRTRNGQWQLTLHRDLVVDYYNQIITSPMFIEKATLPVDSPLIFNSENMTFNQILKNSVELKDKSECPWLIGYYAKNVSSLEGSVNTGATSEGGYIQLTTPIEQWEYYSYSETGNEFIGTLITGSYIIKCIQPGFGNETLLKTNIFNYDLTNIDRIASYSSALTFTGDNEELFSNQFANDLQWAYRTSHPDKNLLRGLVKAYFNYSTTSELEDFLGFKNRTVRDSNGKYFNIRIEALPNKKTTVKFQSGSMFNALTSVVNNTYKDDTNVKWFSGTPNMNSFEGEFETVNYTVIITESTEFSGVNYNISSSRNVTKDVPYDIFAIPYGDIKIEGEDGVSVLIEKTDKQLGLATAMALSINHPSQIYDIQLLPYCPIPELITSNKTITIQNEKQYSFIKEGDSNVGIIFNLSQANFTNIIQFNVPMGETAIERKINNETKKYRLCSPNYSNYFDFSVEMNDGIQYFDIDCNLKPFTPYIHINPNFNGLYGYDDNSPRGLVLGGDFSITQTTDQWQQYQIQNKNFQNIFDRQIQNMQTKNAVGLGQDITTAIAGSATGVAGGALAGSALPGLGTAAGAIAGGAMSLGSGIADIIINQNLRNEAIDYTKDLFHYQLGNIRALPQTISKVSAFNENNKIFPVFESYDCTDTEREAFVNKLAWNGMTTMVIGTIEQFMKNKWTYNDITSKNYIKGQLIRFEFDIETDIEDHDLRSVHSEDFHLVNSISAELNKGVYIWE